MTSYKVLFGMILKVLSVGIREKFYLKCMSVYACVQERGMLNWLRMSVMLYSDNTSVTLQAETM